MDCRTINLTNLAFTSKVFLSGTAEPNALNLIWGIWSMYRYLVLLVMAIAPPGRKARCIDVLGMGIGPRLRGQMFWCVRHGDWSPVKRTWGVFDFGIEHKNVFSLTTGPMRTKFAMERWSIGPIDFAPHLDLSILRAYRQYIPESDIFFKSVTVRS